jgi:hypothetical protein
MTAPAVGVGNEDHGALDPVQHATQVGSVDRHAPQGIGEYVDRVAVALEPITACKIDASSKAPCTSTIVGLDDSPLPEVGKSLSSICL